MYYGNGWLELSPIFDAHGVCASVAYEIAVHRGQDGSERPAAPVIRRLICDPIGALQQTCWEGSERSFAQVIDGNEPAYLEKFGLPADVVLGSDLGCWPAMRYWPCLALPRRADDPYRLAPCLLDPPEGKTVNQRATAGDAHHHLSGPGFPRTNVTGSRSSSTSS